MDSKIFEDVYHYWFGTLADANDFPEGKSELWFKQSEETDRHIRETFGPFISEAAATEWKLGDLARKQLVGLVVLLDQFPRNIFRTSAEAFAYDAAARKITQQLVEKDRDRFFLIEQTFLYLPFEHSEDIADQDYSVFLYAEAALAAPETFKGRYRSFLDYAVKHRELIVKFGRFPHRNEVLGRTSTAEEEAFLKEHGRGY